MNVINNSFFGIFLCIVVYLIGKYLFKKSNGFFLFQPLLVGMVLGIIVLVVIQNWTGASSTEVYAAFWHGGPKEEIGANLIFWFLGPATIAFAIPLYKRNDVVKEYIIEILGALIIGIFISLILIYFESKLLGLNNTLVASILPESATTAIAMPLAQSIGGIPSIAAMTAIINAVIIYALGDQLIKWFKIDDDPIATGLGLGAAGHTIGSAKALELGSVQGAMGSIAVVVSGVVTNFVVPIFAKWFGLI